MECLKSYIGINGCGWVPLVPNPDQVLSDVFSGLYINQLPGITLERLEKLANPEQENFLGVWADVERRALLKFGIHFRGNMGSGFNIRKETQVNCLICSNKALFSVALWYLLGAELMIENNSSNRLNRYTTIDADRAERLKEEFYVEFQASFKDAVNSMDVLNSDCITGCVEVQSNIMFVENRL